MVARFSNWLAAGVITTAVSASVLFGPVGLAWADDQTGTGAEHTGGASSAEHTGPANTGPTAADTKNDPDDGNATTVGRDAPSSTDAQDSPEIATPTTVSTHSDDDAVESPDAAQPSAPEATDRDDQTTNKHQKPNPPAEEQVVTEVSSPRVSDPPERTAPAQDAAVHTVDLAAAAPTPPEPAPRVDPVPSGSPSRDLTTAVASHLPATQAVGLVSATARLAEAPIATAPTIPPVISFIATVIFNLYTAAARLFVGAPVVPPGSTVTVRSSSLHIDCGDGYDVPADWYIPAGAAVTPPTRLVYLQHGFLATGALYSYTAANIAEKTNSIVVATSLTSNFLQCDECSLTGAPMHRAIANLFLDGNTALADSAKLAGYAGPIPQRVVLAGHSAGGGLVAGTTGFMIDNGTFDKLAGVLMLDGVPFADELSDLLPRLPADFPLYNLTGESYVWNMYGKASSELQAGRPGHFNGAQLVGGLHSDTMQGGNPFFQFAAYLATGYGGPQNVAADQLLIDGWIGDMFAGTRTAGLYADPGQSYTVGQATAIALPGPRKELSWIDQLIIFGSGIFDSLTALQGACVVPDDATTSAVACPGFLAA